MQRLKPVESIRFDAIKMGVKKAASGCDGCANGYFELARANGASDQEINRALEHDPSEAIKAYLTRRQMLKGLGVGVAGTAAVAAGLTPLGVAAATDNFGVDTNTVNCCSMPYTFYIGRFGYATSQTTSGFSVTAAQQTPHSSGHYWYSYGYWDLDGPNWPGAGSNPYSWGSSQANAAINGWAGGNPNAPYFWGLTIFADIESGEGWDGPVNQSNNQQVLQAWMDNIRNGSQKTGYTMVPGVYISPGNWSTYFGSSYRPSGSFALWLTGCQTCSISCAPQNNNCSGTVSQAQNTWASYAGQTILGGYWPVVWQYWIGCCGYPGCNTCPPQCNCCNAGDWDLSPQSCYQTISPSNQNPTVAYNNAC